MLTSVLIILIGMVSTVFAYESVGLVAAIGASAVTALALFVAGQMSN